eukprot:CAMPEP_0201596064 /NCGR_PEP_ID=MMETSP0190_2-20130828/192868_1 /ASSEMBLY_ACC=CAM_ASM_000263 /TAXON_ID=37353 /ORGANISM="Rosalina sp." /LENGTH=156 /DNA_ID=CAMNT_0048056277 /DNA_START=471 /DNA_END=941 /DNA_ORIENTATION=+
MRKRARTSTQSTINRIKSMASIDGETSKVVSDLRKKSFNIIVSKVGSSKNSKNSKNSTEDHSAMQSQISLGESNINDDRSKATDYDISRQDQENEETTMDIKAIGSIDPPQHLMQISSISTDDGPLSFDGNNAVEITTLTPQVSKLDNIDEAPKDD